MGPRGFSQIGQNKLAGNRPTPNLNKYQQMNSSNKRATAPMLSMAAVQPNYPGTKLADMLGKFNQR